MNKTNSNIILIFTIVLLFAIGNIYTKYQSCKFSNNYLIVLSRNYDIIGSKGGFNVLFKYRYNGKEYRGSFIEYRDLNRDSIFKLRHFLKIKIDNPDDFLVLNCVAPYGINYDFDKSWKEPPSHCIEY